MPDSIYQTTPIPQDREDCLRRLAELRKDVSDICQYQAGMALSSRDNLQRYGLSYLSWKGNPSQDMRIKQTQIQLLMLWLEENSKEVE